ncbi:MAG: hypothetical protein K5931_03735 [Lachnospiraceae bacterium]|nr:hypothetical protein [Lachnospiraceae bacterium]
MQKDFHYYATYAAANIAGFSPEESLVIAYSAQLVDECSKTFLIKVKGPLTAATTQLQSELSECGEDIFTLQDITRIWSSFHFLPGNLNASYPRRTKRFLYKYRLICNVNSDLEVLMLKKHKGHSLQAYGMCMHVLADTWAHRYFAGTPSFVINDGTDFFEILKNEAGEELEKKIRFMHNPLKADNFSDNTYINSINQDNEKSIMNLGHGRAGHLPDYSFIKYKYLPSWGDYVYLIKDNPTEYYLAFCQMVYALKYLRGDIEDFKKDVYDFESVESYKDEIYGILQKRQLDSCEDWKAFGEKLTGKSIEDFDLFKYQNEYTEASKEEKTNTFLGRFFSAAIDQKILVTDSIFNSGNPLAGYSVEKASRGLGAIKDLIIVGKNTLRRIFHE